MLADVDAWAARPNALCRTLLVELLAWQFASPVRWIETQDRLLAQDDFGVQRVIEIGVGSAPTAANMFRATLAMTPTRIDPPSVHNIEADRRAVFYVYDGDSDDAAERYLIGHMEEQTGDSSVSVMSPSSPLGAALIGAKKGTTVSYKAPNGMLKVRVIDTEVAR